MTREHWGQEAYKAYTQSTGNKTYDGRECPDWTMLPSKIREAWRAVADLFFKPGYDPDRTLEP